MTGPSSSLHDHTTAPVAPLRIRVRECQECKDADYESFWTGITFEVK
ncbi:MAG: hypothetical protein AB1714_01705 [Acidobacteriota bacterium]